MRFLIAEDDFSTRKILQMMLSSYGTCDIAVNGKEALEGVISAYKEGTPYDLLCLDILMPELDGMEVLVKIRDYEDKIGRTGEDALKIIITSGLGDTNHIMSAFDEQCEAYIVKPVEKELLFQTLLKLGLVKE